MLGLSCCTQAFSGCEEQGLLSSCSAQVSYCGGSSCCRTLKDCKSHDPDVATKSTLNIIQGSSKLAESDPQTYFF